MDRIVNCRRFFTALRQLSVCIGVLAALQASAEQPASGVPVKRILIIQSYSSSDQWSQDISNGFRDKLSQLHVVANFETYQLGVREQPGIRPGQTDIDNLQHKINSGRYDLIVAGKNDACELFLTGALTKPKETPLLLRDYLGALSVEQQKQLNMTGVQSVFHPYKNIQLAMKLRPEAEIFALVIEASADGRKQYELAARMPEELRKRVRILSGTELNTATLLEEIAAMSPEKTVLIFNSWSSSLEDIPENSYSVLPDIRNIFSGLILGPQDSYIQIGSSGGVLASGYETGAQAGELGARILNGEHAADIPFEKRITHCRIDYPSLDKYNIDQAGLPIETEFVNVPPDFLIRYRLPLAAGTVIVFTVLVLCIILLGVRRRDQRRIEMLFSHLPQQIIICDEKGNILFSHMPKSFADPPDNNANELNRSVDLRDSEVSAAFRKVFATGKNVDLDFESRGCFRHAEFILLPEKNPFGTRAVMGIAGDITELHNAHVAMSHMAGRLRMTLESIGDAVIATDREERITMFNPVAVELTGYAAEEAIGRPLTEVFNIRSYIDDHPVDSPLRAALISGGTVELANHTDLIARDGVRRHIADCAAPIRDENGEITGGVLVFRDVTDDYEKRDLLRMHGVVLGATEKLGRIGHFRCEENGRPLVSLPEEYWPRRRGKSVPYTEWIAAEDQKEFISEWHKFIRSKAHEMHLSYSAGTPRRYFDLRVERSMSEISGKLEFFGVVQDVTATREQEFRYRDNFRLLRNIVDNLPGYIFVKNADDNYRYIMFNQGFRELTGFPGNRSIVGCTDKDIFTLDEAASRKFRADDEAVIASRKPISINETFTDFDGRKIYCRTIKSSMIQSDGTRLLVGIGVDMSQQHELERKQERMIEELNRFAMNERIVNQALSMITVEPDIDKALNEMLRIIGENAGADRAFIYRYNDDFSLAWNEYEWIRDGVEMSSDGADRVDMDQLSGWTRWLEDKKEIIISDCSNPPEELKPAIAPLSPLKIKSILVSAICHDNKLSGFVGLNFVKESRKFNENSIYAVRSIANLLLLARERHAQMLKIADNISLQRQIVDNITIPIAIIDSRCKIQMANTSMLKMLGVTYEDLQKYNCHDLICGNGQPPEWCCLSCNNDTKTRSISIEHNGRMYIVNNQPIFDRDHKLQYALTSFFDVTEINRQKEDLRLAMERAQAADRAKSYFLATVSHELRTPLNAVIGFSELLQNSETPQSERQDYLRAINYSGNVLLNLINDVLDLSKLEADQLNIAPIRTDMAALVAEISAVFQLKIKEKNIGLKVSTSGLNCPIYVDQLRIRQILLNLIGNAVKFTNTGGVSVNVDFMPDHENVGTLVMQVSDSGIGISSENVGKIFDPFVQLESTRGGRVFEGSGLGLAISKRLVQKMGGVIELDSQEGQGSIFTVRLPGTKFGPGVLTPAAANADYMVAARRVLLVDDVPMNLKVLQAMLKKLQVQCVCVKSGSEALKQLSSGEKFDRILTDLWMPEMNGEELARRIRQLPGTADIPIIAVTADMENSRIFDVTLFSAVLLKPVTLEQLVGALRK